MIILLLLYISFIFLHSLSNCCLMMGIKPEINYKYKSTSMNLSFLFCLTYSGVQDFLEIINLNLPLCEQLTTFPEISSSEPKTYQIQLGFISMPGDLVIFCKEETLTSFTWRFKTKNC